MRDAKSQEPQGDREEVHIIYASCACSKQRFFELFTKNDEMPGQQVQKYHTLMLQGLAANDARVETVTALPVSRSNSRRLFISVKGDREAGVDYKYLPTVNITGIKNLANFVGSFMVVSRRVRGKRSAVIMCDILNVSVSTGALLAGKVFHRRTVGIVTDIPHFLNPGPRSITVRLAEMAMRWFDSYLFLTEDMNRIVNQRQVPYVVIEGQVDANMSDRENRLSLKSNKKICLYAGSLDMKNGIRSLVDGFISAGYAGAELHVYGRGDYEEHLKQICTAHTNVRYFGQVPNDRVVEAQLRATILFNPRPTTEEYTKYSYPSKNMECMASGTPLVTTRLPGMPEEYLPYVYILQNETPNGIAAKLRELLSRPPAELHHTGIEAREFVLKNKTNVTQAQRLLKMLTDEGWLTR